MLVAPPPTRAHRYDDQVVFDAGFIGMQGCRLLLHEDSIAWYTRRVQIGCDCVVAKLRESFCVNCLHPLAARQC